jgi:hypothetical protein
MNLANQEHYGITRYPAESWGSFIRRLREFLRNEECAFAAANCGYPAPSPSAPNVINLSEYKQGRP